MENRRILESWKEISAHLGQKGRTCQRWECEMGLPIHRLDGDEADLPSLLEVPPDKRKG